MEICGAVLDRLLAEHPFHESQVVFGRSREPQLVFHQQIVGVALLDRLRGIYGNVACQRDPGGGRSHAIRLRRGFRGGHGSGNSC